MERRSAARTLRALGALGAFACVVFAVPVAAEASVSVEVLSNGGGLSGPPSASYQHETFDDAVAYVESEGGGNVTFAPSLVGQTITLTAAPPDITEPTTITGPSSGTITISGNDAVALFDVSAAVSLSLSNLTLTGGIGTDISKYEGGAVYSVPGSTVTIENSTLTDNTARAVPAPSEGGAVDAGGALTIESSTISNNSAGEGGGIEAGGSTTISGSTISGNSSSYGGGIYNYGGNVTVSDSTLTGNTAPDDGGPGGGGAILEYGDSTLTVTSSTIVGNSADGTAFEPIGGGGIWADDANQPVSLVDSIVADNTGIEGADILGNATTPATTATYSLIGNPSGDGITGSTSTDLLGTATAPLNPLLGNLANNGGPTQTMLPLVGSPVIDAGIAPSGETTDQRGDPRTVKLGFTEPSGGDGTDIGAAELQASEIAAPVVNGVTPSSGAAGTTVTINGTNLFPATEVLFGATPATSVTAVSNTMITATVPAGTGTVDVRVVAPAGESALTTYDHFTYPTATQTTQTTQTTTFGDQQITLTTPTASVCTAPTGKLHVTFRTAKHGSKKPTLTFKRAAFYLDKGVKHTKKVHKRRVTTYTPNATSRKTAASVSLSLKGVKAGKHTLKTVISYTEHVKHGKKTRVVTVTKTIKSTVSVC